MSRSPDRCQFRVRHPIQILERELAGFIAELQSQGRHTDAALLDMAIFHAKGHLPDLIDLRDKWDDLL
jgi:hypothetical protein